MKKILVTATNYSKYCYEAKQLLERHGFEVIENKLNRPLKFSELTEFVLEVDGVIAGVDAWNEDIFKLAPKLKIICRFGVGVDNIDLIKAKEYGITVTNAVGANSNAVAELTVSLIFGIVRNIIQLNSSTRMGHWDRFIFREIKGMNIGLIGFGAIGQMVAYKMAGFDVKLFAYDKYPNLSKAKVLDVNLVSFEEVLSISDVVSLHIPSLKETYNMMGKEQLSLMKNGSYFINTARGALVDEKALYEALRSGKLAGAAIDVYKQEPVLPDNPLLKLDNIICTPHIAGETYENYKATSMITANAIIDYFKGEKPENGLNFNFGGE